MSTTSVFRVEGMKCQGCIAEIEKALEEIPELDEFKVSLVPPQIQFSSDSEIPISTANGWLPKKFSLVEPGNSAGENLSQQTVQIGSSDRPKLESSLPEPTLPKKSFATYWPLLLVVSYVLAGTLIAMSISSDWSWGNGMRMFMGLFFIAFSFFKLLDLNGFANAYRGYDWVARIIPGYGLVYPFIELSLGCCYLTGVAPLAVNVITLVVMSVSIGGVIESVLKKRTIRCACLGTGFNLPMSQVTIIEDGAMILMAAIMILKLSV